MRLLTRAKQLLRTNWGLYSISFILPIVMVMVWFIAERIIPFGHRSIFTMDMTGQYIPLLGYAKRVLLHDHSAIFYSFSKGLGGDMLGVWAYYLLNPINWIFWLFKTSLWPLIMSLITLFNYGSMGLCMAVFLNKTTPTKRPMILIWSLAYALNAWMLINQLNIIWLLAITILPLSMLGLYQLIYYRHWFLYLSTMTIMMVSNFYMFFILGTFSLIYVLTILTLQPLPNQKLVKLAMARYMMYSIFSVLLSAFIWIPTFINLLSSKAGTKSYTSIWALLNGPFSVFQKLFNGSFQGSDIINGDIPIYSSLLTLLAFIGFFWLKKFSTKQKVIIGGITIFYYLASFLPPLLIILQAGQMPNGYTFRYAFTIIFWMILIASYGFEGFLQLPVNTFFKIAYWLIVSVIVVTIDNIFEPYHIKTFNIVVTMFLLFVYLVWFYYHKTFVHPRIWLLGLVILDLGFNGLVTYHKLDFKTHTTQNIQRYAKQGQYIKRFEHSNHDFYRIQPLQLWTPNDALNYGYTSNSEAVSTFEHTQSIFDWNLGFNSDDISSITSNTTLFMDKLLGFKYLISDSNLPNKQLTNVFVAKRLDINQYQKFLQADTKTVYRINQTLPLGFLTTNSILKKPNMVHSNTYTNSGIQNQQRLFEQVFNTNQKLFETISAPLIRTQHAHVLHNKKFLVIRAKHIKQMQNKIVFKFTPKTNDAYYISLHTPQFVKDPQNVDLSSKVYRHFGLNFKVNGHRQPIGSDDSHQVIYNVASKMKNKSVTIEFNLGSQQWALQSDLNQNALPIYHLKQTVLNQQMHKTLQRPKLQISSMNNNHLKGHINVLNNQYRYLTTTIPATNGWHLKVDGKSSGFKKWENELMVIPLTKGFHTIELTYTPPYLWLGVYVSVISLISLLILYLSLQFRIWFKYR